MSRQWIKLYTRMLEEPWVIRLSDRAHRHFVSCLLIAGRNDDDGRIGTISDVSLLLRCRNSTVSRSVAEINGRIIERDGELWVRDWDEWQPPKRKPEPKERVLARVRAHRKRQRNGDVTQPLQTCNASLEQDIEIEQDKEPTRHTPRGAWAATEAALADAFGGVGTRRKDGQPLAWVGQAIAVIGRHVDCDDKGAAAVRDFAASDDFEYANADSKLAGKVGKWFTRRNSHRRLDPASQEAWAHRKPGVQR